MKADCDAINKRRVQSCRSLLVFLQGRKKAFFINSPSHTAIPQAQIEQGERARGRLREGEREQRFDKEGESLISVLHTLLDDQSRKCCFNSKNHISSPVHKLIIENYAAGQRGREDEEKARQRRNAERDPKIQLVHHNVFNTHYLLSTNLQPTFLDL